MRYSVSQEEKYSYRSIFKAASLFGGVQVYQILIGIIKSKVIAVLLGPLGVGVLGLYTSAEQLLKSITSMGLQYSAVRDISEANSSGESDRVSLKITVLKRLILFTGLLGMVAMIILSPVLSKVSFGNYNYIIPFVLFSVCMLLDQICNGQKIILQGLRQLKQLAIVTAISSTVGLLVSIPVYYLWGIDGIVPTLMLTSCAALLFAWLAVRKISIKKLYTMAHKKFEFNFSPAFRRLFILESMVLLICLGIVLFLSSLYKYIAGSILIVIASFYSINELNKRIGLVNLVKSYGRKK